MGTLSRGLLLFLVPLGILPASSSGMMEGSVCRPSAPWLVFDFPAYDGGDKYVFHYEFTSPVDLDFGFQLYIENPRNPATTYGSRGRLVLDYSGFPDKCEAGDSVIGMGVLTSSSMSVSYNNMTFITETRAEDGTICRWATVFEVGYAIPYHFEFSPNGNGFSAQTANGVAAKGGIIYTQPWRFYYRDLEESYHDPVAGILPLGEMLFKEEDYKYVSVDWEPETLVLRLFDHFDEFPHFPAKWLEDGRECIEIPLVTKDGDFGSYRSLRTKELYCYSRDGKEMKPLSARQPGDLIGNEFRIPRVGSGEGKEYAFEIFAGGFGELDRWSFTYPFSVTVDRNWFGSCRTSAWCVEEI